MLTNWENNHPSLCEELGFQLGMFDSVFLDAATSSAFNSL
jgi:hypothetical protein